MQQHPIGAVSVALINFLPIRVQLMRIRFGDSEWIIDAHAGEI